MIYNPYIVYDIFSFNRYGYSCKTLLTCKKFVCNWCLYRISSRGDFQTAWSLICCGALCVWLIHKVRYDCFEFLIHSSVLVFDPLKWWTQILLLIHFCWWYCNWNKINFGEKGGSKTSRQVPKNGSFRWESNFSIRSNL